MLLCTGILATTKSSCSASLPRVWTLNTDDPTSRPVPTRHNLSSTNATVVGGDFDSSLLSRSVRVLVPLDDWILTYQHVKARIARLEKLGKQIKSSLQSSKFTSMLNKRRQERGGEDSTFTATTCADDEMTIEERRHDAMVKTWEENEKSITEQLTVLITDSSYCKSIILSQFIAIKETIQASLVALGPCKQPLPGYSSSSIHTHGEVFSNNELIRSMPVSNVEAASNKFDPSSSAIVTRLATSSPLQIATSSVPTPRYAPVDYTQMPFAHKLELIEKQDDEMETS